MRVLIVLVLAAEAQAFRGRVHDSNPASEAANESKGVESPGGPVHDSRPALVVASGVNKDLHFPGGEDPDEVLDEVSDKFQRQLGKSYNRTLREVFSISTLPRELFRLSVSVQRTFLPHWEFSLRGFLKAFFTVLISIVWFHVYFRMIYRTDRDPTFDRWTLEPLEHSGRGLLPDFVLVFHHPSYKYDDADSAVGYKSLQRVLVPGVVCPFERLRHLQNKSAKATGLVTEIIERTKKRTRTLMRSPPPREDSDEQPEVEDDTITKKDVRVAMLKDVYLQLPSWGFDVVSFSSIDNDELFVAVTLKHKKSIDYFLARNNLQLQLRGDVVAKLGIEQDLDDPACSPPYVAYDENLIRRLAEQNVLDSADERELFKSTQGSGKDSVVNGQDCIRLVWHELIEHINLFAAREEGFLVGFYPVHNPNRVSELRASWATWRHLSDLSFVQPIPRIRDYFGARTAFLFAWNGHYCKTLLALVIVAMLQELAVFFCNFILGIRVLKTRQVVGFSVVVVVWAKITSNLWQREECFFIESWNLRAHDLVKFMRPQFQGVPEPSPLDRNLIEKQYPRHLQFYRRLFTACATVFFCAVVATTIFFWMMIFEGKMGIFSSMMLSLQIKVFEGVFHWLVPIMTEYENHRYSDDYHNSLLWKLFLFDFVNNYCAFFSITVRDAWRGIRGTEEEWDDCITVLKKQIFFTLCLLCFCSVAQMLAHSFIVRMRLWYEAYQLKKKTGEAPKRYFIEEQAKYATITEEEECQNMITLVITLGFVLLFGGVTAIVIPFCFVIFAVQLRAFSVFITSDAQRIFPHDSIGIGNWLWCIKFLMGIGVLYSGFLFVVFGSTFKNSELLAKMTGLMLFCLAAAMLWVVLDLICPITDLDTKLLESRRGYVVSKLMKTAGSNKLKDALVESRTATECAYLEAVQHEQWSKIPQLSAMPQTPLTLSRTVSVHHA